MLKWLTLSLFAYVAALFAIKVPWGDALIGLFVAAHNLEAMNSSRRCLAIFGTTISPYLFFWQASQEAEDQRINRFEKHSPGHLNQAAQAFDVSAPIR